MGTALKSISGNVFEAEDLARYSSFSVPQGSPLRKAIKAIRTLVSSKNPWVCDVETMQAIAKKPGVEINIREENEAGNGSFIIRMNLTPLIIGHPNGTISINMNYDRTVRVQAAYERAQEARFPDAPIPPVLNPMFPFCIVS
jgi:hypothetical protein